MYNYTLPVDCSDIVQMTVFRSEGVQLALKKVAEEYSRITECAEDGVILSLEREEELTNEQLEGIHQALANGWESYLATK